MIRRTHCPEGGHRASQLTRAEADLAKVARAALGENRHATISRGRIPAMKAQVEDAREVIAEHLAACDACAERGGA